MQRLETERLILRSFTDLDADDHFRYAADPEVGPRAGWKPHESREESLSIIHEFNAGGNVFAIERKSDHRVIGSLGLHKDKSRNLPDVLAIGYVLSQDCWGNGYMTEAVKRVLRYGFEEMGLRLMSISHYTFNDRSRRVIEKCGFVYEGTMRQTFLRYDGAVFDESMYSLTKEEWLSRQADAETMHGQASEE
jgi:[ribosomal protein S5]-alanine N-acetyltransferase